MGIQTEAKQNYNKLNKLINSSRFNESFLLLKNQFSLYPNLAKNASSLRNHEANYKYMLDYIAEGNPDPSQDDMIEQLREILFRANDLVLRETLLKDSGDLYSSSRRMFSLRNTTLKSLFEEYDKIIEEVFKDKKEESKRVITASQSKIINEIFNYIWTLYDADASEYEFLSSVLDGEEYPEYLKLLLVSAIILGNTSFFNPETYEILLNQYENTNSINIKARVIVGIVLISLLNPKRVQGNLRLRSRLLLTSEDEDLKKLVDEVLINIIRTYDTKRIDSKMRNEVIPGLMKINPEIINKMRNLSSESENFLSEGNPEWEKMIEESGISDKLKEINDMQLEGADVMVTAFSNLKGFPFFAQPANWFLPFSPGYYEFASLPLQNDDENVKRLTTVMCDSDLHSFLLSLGTMPEDKRNLMISNMQNQMQQAYEAMSDSVGESEAQTLSKKIRHSLQDIYRFFKFFRKKEDFSDPFANPFLGRDIESLISLFGVEINNIKLIAEFYFKNKYYEEAAGIFELINKLDPGNFNIWEKTGYCYERLGRYEEAVNWYSKSELINNDNSWLIKRLAISLKNSGHQEKAIPYYNKALSTDPDNYHLIMSAGECLLASGRYPEALQKFYHAQYLKPNKKDAQRAVAWAELLSNNYDKANSQYKRILEEPDADKTDYLNAAHSALASGDFKSALEGYKSFVEKSENRDITSLVLAFRDDTQTLKQLGIKTSDLRLIVDKIRYDLIS